MQQKEKDQIILRLAATFRQILKNKKEEESLNRMNDKEDIYLVSSMRQLEADSGLSYNIIQPLFTGKKDIQFTTLIALIESFGHSLSEFAQIYDKLSPKQLAAEKSEIEKKIKKKEI